MKVLVFGGSGFLGSHTADALTKVGHAVTIFDIYESLYLQENQKMIVGDILDSKQVNEAVKNAEIVYNFAGIADIKEAKSNPVKTVEINTLGNTIILNACRMYDVKRFIFASSLYVYNELGSFYRSSKQACEILIENFNYEYGLPFTILRYGSLYGPRANEWNGIYRVLKQAVTEGEIRFEGSGDEVREFIHVIDAAEQSVQILDEQYENQYIILTGTEKMKYKDLIKMINEMMGNNLEIKFINCDNRDHYEITPYSFKPKVAKKMTSTLFRDLGQGILECISEIYEKVDSGREFMGDV